MSVSVLTQPIIPGLWMSLPSSAVSTEASDITKQSESLKRYHEQSLALFGDKARLLESLCELSQECLQDDWDGYGANAINLIAVKNAKNLIRALPDGFEMPELSVDPDGDVSFDWMPSHTKTFTLSVNSSCRLAYAWIDGTDRGHAVAKFENGVIPDRILAEIRRITNYGFAFRIA